MKTNKRIFPEYRGFKFWLTELFPSYGNESSKCYGYQLREVSHYDERRGSYGTCHHEGGGAYPTKHEATKAAFARIERLTFDR
jgi:hypothetical protein